MNQPPIELKRADLYKEVWKTPMRNLAKKYGLSDRGLSKICNKLDIPTPPRGYWAKVQNGIKVPRSRLPKPGKHTPTAHTVYPQLIVKRGSQQQELSQEAIALISLESNTNKLIKVPERLRQPSEFIRGIDNHLKKADLWGPLPYQPLGKPLAIRVGPESRNRALRIMHALIKGLEKRGFPVTAKIGLNRAPFVSILGENLHFSIFERYKQRDETPAKTESEKENLTEHIYSSPNRIYIRTGILTFRIHGADLPSSSTTWSDTAKKRLENLLNRIVVGLIKSADSSRNYRLEKEEQHRKWEEKQRLLAEERQRQLAEEKRIQEFEQQADLWAKYNKLCAFIQEVRRRGSENSQSVESQKRMDDWLKWARDHAEHVNPLKGALPFE